MRFWLLVILILIPFLPANADQQVGVALDTPSTEVRVLNNGIDFNHAFMQLNHGSFLADFETDFEGHQVYLCPSFGYQLYTEYKRFAPYTYFMGGATTTVGQGTTLSTSIGQGVDFRIKPKLALRFEHEFDWSRTDSNQWSNRYSVMLVWNIK